MYFGRICAVSFLTSAAFFLGACTHPQISSCCNGPVDPPMKKPLHYGPNFYKRHVMDPASLAVAANHFIAVGETRAVAELLEQDRKMADKHRRHPLADGRYRLFWICRVVFDGTSRPVTPPRLGDLIMLPESAMTPTDWPQMPMAKSQGVYFLLSDGYARAGVAEPFPDFLERCRKEGKFRTTPLPVPNQAEAAAALKALTQQPRWKRLPGNPSINSFALHGLLRQVAATTE